MATTFRTATLFSSQPRLTGRSVGILTNAGGLGILCADACESVGLEVPTLGDDTRAALQEVPEAQRTARYRCVVAYLETPTAAPEIVEASCEGYILDAPRGTGGFGYDPLFFSTDLQMSFGEAAPGAKHRVSHRGRAFRALIEVLLRRVK